MHEEEIDPDSVYICEECCKTGLLKQFASKQIGFQVCVFCKREVRHAVHTIDMMFVKAMKASMLYYFSEWQFNSHFGGDSLESLLAVRNPLLNSDGKLDESNLEGVLLSFIDQFRKVETISMFTEWLEPAIRYGHHPLIEEISKVLKKKNHFVVEDEFEARFRPLQPYICHSINTSEVFYRARIGSTVRAEDVDLPSKKRTRYHEPLGAEKIGAPPVGLSRGGRLNRPGVSFLYLGSTKDTAISEVRPHPGEAVSLGSFSATRNLNVADFSKHDLSKLYSSDEELRLLRLIITIERALAEMAPPSNQAIYSVTQFIGEVFRRMGFDGIMYRSTVADGYNLAVFQPALFKWNDSSAETVAVTNVKYDYSIAPKFAPDAWYDIDHTRVPETSK